ncbi:formin-like protein 3 [Ptychodera flava]|uniref:formin-like protein 3 n=1 Tax=Ptychodera flava TaxID=63121 RepID=UPI003969FCD2
MVKDKKTTGFDSTRELGAGSVGRRTRMEAASSMAMVESASVSAYTESEAGTEYDELDVFKDGFGNNAIPLPGEATINRRFEKYLNSRENMTEEGRQQLRHLPLEDKWRLLNETAAPSPSHHASFYVEQLKRHMHPDMHTIKKINKKMVKDLTPVPKVLQWLKEDLGSFDITFLTDFISSPNNGVDVLIEFLHDIQLHHNEGIPFVAGTTRKAPGATIPKQYQDTLKRKPKDKLDCLECLMDIIESSEEGSRLFTDSKKSMETLSQSLMDISMQIRIRALQIMTLLCSNKDGHDYVLNTMTYIKLKMGESMRFKLLITMLHAEPPNRNFQLVCLRFLNKLLNSTQNVNERAYLQYELLQLANFDPYAVQPLQGTYDEEIAQELELWHNEFIDIQGLHDDFKQLENRNKLLRKEVTMLTAKIKTLETEYEENRLNLSEIKQSNEQYRLKVAVLQDKLQDAVRRHQNSKSRGEDIEHVYDETANTGLTGDGISPTDDGYDDGESSRSSLPVLAAPLTSNLEGPAPPPPPPPPSARLIGNERKKRTIRSNVPLPMLNWIPMTAAGNTVFKEVDDENVLKEVDFRILKIASKRDRDLRAAT